MITFNLSGSDRKLRRVLEDIAKKNPSGILAKYGQMGVDALAASTPSDTGKTAASWEYDVKQTSSGYKIEFRNTNINKNVNIALILQLGHGTGTGGYVRGIDYINPAMQPVFERMATDLYNELTR
ncbi:MAG: HK97 gp10 family phage protein [Staphylococcus hominis]|nr:MAG: HK97 gp10 family phage protein [Staphylococcus hominis]